MKYWILSLMVVLTLAAGCGRKLVRTLVPPDEIHTLDARSPFLKAHLRDGGVYILSSWRVDSTTASIVGTGTRFDAGRREIASGEFSLASDSVALFETNVEHATGSAGALTLMTGITAAVATICISNPKTCFGSCPTFYALDEAGEMRLQAEGFSASIAPALEATDVDMLLHTRPVERDFRIRVTNEALETHVIRHANVLAVPRADGARVYMTSAGAFHETFSPTPPSRAVDATGDCLDRLRRADGDERSSLADSTDLAARETIELEFREVPGGDLGLVIVSRQSLMTTFLIYQSLAYMGSDAGRWLAMLETGGDMLLERAGEMGRVLGTVEVLVPGGDGEWVVTGHVGETGPIAVDTRVVPLPSGDMSRVRLRLTRGLWRLDQVALVSLGGAVTPRRLHPVAVTRDGEADARALRALIEPDETLITLPGDELEFTYRLPEDPPGHELFLEATGYYLEWMREEWMAEENPVRAAQLVLDPAGVMRDLAPAFKAVEPEIEDLFWNSRYVKP